MPMHAKIGGVWKTLDPKVKIGGAWKTVQSGWVRVAGTWRQFYSSAATITVGSVNVFNTNAGAKAAQCVGAAGGRLCAVTIGTNSYASLGTMTDDKGGTWTPALQGSNSAPNRSCAIWYRNELLTDGSTVTVTWTPAASPVNDGGGLYLFRVDGLTGAWTTNGKGTSDPANSVPSLTSLSPASARSVMIGVVVSSTIAPNQPTNWIADLQSSYATPTLFATIAHCAAPNATQTTTWGAASATNWCGCQMEIVP